MFQRRALVHMVVLNPAYSWDCPDCGAENFVRGIIPEMSEIEYKVTKADLGIEPGDDGEIMLMPEEVTCCDCGGTFPTTHYGEV